MLQCWAQAVRLGAALYAATVALLCLLVFSMWLVSRTHATAYRRLNRLTVLNLSTIGALAFCCVLNVLWQAGWLQP